MQMICNSDHLLPEGIRVIDSTKNMKPKLPISTQNTKGNVVHNYVLPKQDRNVHRLHFLKGFEGYLDKIVFLYLVFRYTRLLRPLRMRGHPFSHGLGVSMPRAFRKGMACHGNMHTNTHPFSQVSLVDLDIMILMYVLQMHAFEENYLFA